MSSVQLLSPSEFFREKLTAVLDNRKHSLNDETEFYLVNLLVSFINHEKLTASEELDIDIMNTPLALILKTALESTQEKKFKLFKLLGDTSLYFSGYFQESFNRRTYDVDYFIDMGSTAYDQVSRLIRDQTQERSFSQLYTDLAKDFSLYVEIIAEIAELTGGERSCPRNLVAIYDRWTKSQSERLFKILKEEGINPIPIDTRSRQ